MAAEMETESIVVPKFQAQVRSDFGNDNKTESNVCPVCRGSGWELYTPDPRELEYVYGDRGITTEFARKCTKCNGIQTESVDMTGVPDLYRDADLTKFKFDIYSVDLTKFRKIVESLVFSFDKWKANGKGLYLWSKTPGSGKSFLASCIGKSVMVKYGIRFRFITIIDYIDKVSESYSIKKNGGFEDPSRTFRECDLLVLDDVGTQVSKEWQEQEVFKLVNERQANGLVTIFTSNYPPEGLNIDERTKSRIMKSSIVLQMPEESIRQTIANDEQAEFLKGIL